MAKSFKDKMQEKAQNPTLQFITPPPAEVEPIEKKPRRQKPEATPSTPRKALPARRALPQYDEETKSRRLQLLLTPSLYEAVKAQAAENRMSINEFVNAALRDATERK